MKIPEHWTFKSDAIASGFDSHVREQLPWYDLATSVVAHVANHYIPQGGWVYDIGASTGNIGRAIADTLKQRQAKLVAIDNAKEMRHHYRGPVPLTIADATTYDYKPFDLAICFLVLLFIAPSKRVELIKRLRSKLNHGGAIVIVDKCVPASGYVATVMYRLTLAAKLAGGTSAEDILAKDLALAGVQRPICQQELGEAQEIFRFGDFAAWVLEST